MSETENTTASDEGQIGTAEGYRRQALRQFDDALTTVDDQVTDAISLGVTNMGRATNCSDEIAKVQVSRGVDAAMFRLFLNPEKFSGFTIEERAGVVWHELNHILHDHLSHFVDNEGMDDRQKLTIAQEIVCNDTVLHHGVSLPLLDSLFHGERILGYNTFPKSTQEVYELLDDEAMDKANQAPDCDECGGTGEKPQDSQDGDSGDDQGDGSDGGEDDGSGSGSGEGEGDGSGSGSGSGEKCEKCGGSGKKPGQPGDGQGGSGQPGGGSGGCGGIEIDPDLTAEEISDLVDSIRDGLSDGDMEAISDALGGKMPGTDSTGGSLSLDKREDVSADWVSLLRHIEPEVADEVGGMSATRTVADWRSQPLFSYGVSSAGRLPVFVPEGDLAGSGDDVRPTFILAVDQSGSIPAEVARKARELATTIPSELADVRVCVFGTQWAEMDLSDGAISDRHGYGTDFTAVSDFVEHVGSNERTSVLVFTDGYAGFSGGVPENIENYWWLQVCGGYDDFSKILNQYVPGRIPEDQIIDRADFTEGL